MFDEGKTEEGAEEGAGVAGIQSFQTHNSFSLTNILQLSAYDSTHQLSKASSLRFDLALLEARQMVDILVVVSMAVSFMWLGKCVVCVFSMIVWEGEERKSARARKRAKLSERARQKVTER